MSKDKWLEKLDEVEKLLKLKAGERWSSSEKQEILKRGEVSADYYMIWDKLCIIWNMKEWVKKYGYLTYNQKVMLKKFKSEVI